MESLLGQFPITRLHVQVTAAKRGEDNFRIADNPGDGPFNHHKRVSVLIRRTCYRPLPLQRNFYQLYLRLI